MAQRYSSPVAALRMADGRCPECGQEPDQHLSDNRFWLPRQCDLMPRGVTERIEQYESDLVAEEA